MDRMTDQVLTIAAQVLQPSLHMRAEVEPVYLCMYKFIPTVAKSGRSHSRSISSSGASAPGDWEKHIHLKCCTIIKPMHTTSLEDIQYPHLLWIVWMCLGAVQGHQLLLVWTQTASLTLVLLGNFLIQSQAASIQRVAVVQCRYVCTHTCAYTFQTLAYINAHLHTSIYLPMLSSAPTPGVTSSINSQWKLISSTHSYDFLSIEMIHFCWLLL